MICVHSIQIRRMIFKILTLSFRCYSKNWVKKMYFLSCQVGIRLMKKKSRTHSDLIRNPDEITDIAMGGYLITIIKSKLMSHIEQIVQNLSSTTLRNKTKTNDWECDDEIYQSLCFKLWIFLSIGIYYL